MKNRYISLIASLVLLMGLTGCPDGSKSGGGGSGSPQPNPSINMGGSIQGNALNLSATVSTLAGTPFSKDGIGFAANFNHPLGMVEAGGSLYVADNYSHTIRKIDLSSWAVTTFAGTAGRTGSTDGIGATARFMYPTGIATDGTSLYVADSSRGTIRRIDLSSGQVTTLAGGGYGYVNAPGLAARFRSPRGLVTDGTNLYVADTYNHAIRKIVISTGEVTTLAGGSAGTFDGTGTTAQFYVPTALATDGVNLYVADTYNHAIRKIVISSGVVTTLAGQKGVLGSNNNTTGTVATLAHFWAPQGIAINGNSLYVTDTANHSIRKITPVSGLLNVMTSVNAVVTTYAGTAGNINSYDGFGAGAAFRSPAGIATYGNSLFVADTENLMIRRIYTTNNSGGTVSWAAGLPVGSDGTGVWSRFNITGNYTTDGTNIYVADSGDHTIRRIVISTGAVSTLVGKAGVAGNADGHAGVARFNVPRGITNDGASLYVADAYNNTIRKIAPTSGSLSDMTSFNANVTTLAGAVNAESGYVNAMGTVARFFQPWGITTDGRSLYVADTNNHAIRKITPSDNDLSAMTSANAVVTTLAGGGPGSPGNIDATGESALFRNPAGITTDGTNLYIADRVNHTVRKIAPLNGSLSGMTSATANVATLAGTAGSMGSANNIGSNARFNYPSGITTDGIYLYVTDSNNNTIRKIAPISGNLSVMNSINANVTTLAGNPGTVGVVDATGTSALFWNPWGITTDGKRLFIGDSEGGTVRAMQ